MSSNTVYHTPPLLMYIILLEKSGRCGGWLSSIRRDDGAVFEQGPQGVRPAGAVGRNTLNLETEKTVFIYKGSCGV